MTKLSRCEPKPPSHGHGLQPGCLLGIPTRLMTTLCFCCAHRGHLQSLSVSWSALHLADGLRGSSIVQSNPYPVVFDVGIQRFVELSDRFVKQQLEHEKSRQSQRRFCRCCDATAIMWEGDSHIRTRPTRPRGDGFMCPSNVICFNATLSNARYSIHTATSQDARQLGSYRSF